MHITETAIQQRNNTCFLFEPKKGTREAHILLQSAPGLSVTDAWIDIMTKLEKLEEELNFNTGSRLFFRVFLSDVLNQEKILREHFPEFFARSKRTNVSLVQQPPMPHSKLAVWVYEVDGEQKVESTENGNVFHSNGVTHVWTSGLMGSDSTNVFWQTESMFLKYMEVLKNYNADLLHHSLRTWVFVRDVDTVYQDVVKARRLVFQEQGLTPETHYVASTGIEGKNENPHQHVFMDAYSVIGLKPEQVQYLKAPTHLCPTHEYGVTFERGTSVTYGDRKHVYISGTASIDNSGEILFPESIKDQTRRMLENVEVLLTEAGCSLSDLAMALVYIRDIADFKTVNKIIEKVIPDVPFLVLVAPVCRPAWLVEMEGIAVKKIPEKITGINFQNY